MPFYGFNRPGQKLKAFVAPVASRREVGPSSIHFASVQRIRADDLKIMKFRCWFEGADVDAP